MSESPYAEIGVFGGSGFYSLLQDVEEIALETPYGPPSDSIFLADHAGRRVAFLPRHGRGHTIPPHRINYRANVWAMKRLGVRSLICPGAAGSLQSHIEPEHFVVCDQYVDRNTDRIDTFDEGSSPSSANAGGEPYCPALREIAIRTIRDHDVTVHEKGTVVVIQGPRFSSKAESRWFTESGWDVVSMTAYPENSLAQELGIASVGISLVTDYDSGLVVLGDVPPVSTRDALQVFLKNSGRIKSIVLDLIALCP